MKIVIDGHLIDPGLVTRIEPPNGNLMFVIHYVGGEEFYITRFVNNIEEYEHNLKEIERLYDEFMKYWEPDGKFITIK